MSEIRRDQKVCKCLYLRFIHDNTVHYCISCVTQKKSQNLTHQSLIILINLINKKHGNWTLQQTIWLWNHTSHTKVYFNEFVSNAFRDNIGVIIFDLGGCGGCQRPKTYLGTHFGTSTQSFFIPQQQTWLPNIHQDMRSVITLSFHSASIHISNSRTKPAGFYFLFILKVKYIKWTTYETIFSQTYKVRMK